MPMQHIRNLAKYGIITDVSPYDLPPEAFSGGVNVRFRNGKVTGAPVFRNVLNLGTTNPRYVFSANPTNGLDLLFIGYQNGTVTRYASGAETAYSIASYTPVAVEASWTDTSLANVVYVNRADRPPWYFRPSDTQFQNLGLTTWDPTWSCRILRTCAGALVALNVTKGATVYPSMVKTSSIPTTGIVPASWDQTVPSTLATENILAEMQSPIIDACKLGEALIIYGLKEAWMMRANGQTTVYDYEPLPFKKGAMNANCSVEFDGKNIVFGPDDIWLHDGTSEKSIADQRVRDFIFDNINLSRASSCFVKHNPKLTEIIFAYVSGDTFVSFPTSTAGCNKQAVWNYASDTWTFDDLPYAFAATNANLNTATTYDTITATYDTVGGSYQDQEDGFKRSPVYVGDTNATYSLTKSLYAFDLYGQGSTVSFPVDVNATKPRILKRDGIDLDALNADLRGYKLVTSVYPQIRLGVDAASVNIFMGASDAFNVDPVFSPVQYYNGVDLYKLDYNMAGRYLAMFLKHLDYREIAITGFDIELKGTANR